MGQINNERLPVEELIGLVKYDPETGIITKIGTSEELGYLDNKGYVFVCLKGMTFRAHRVAWACMTKEWPRHLIDHINGVKGDNRWANLRAATNAENMRNTYLYRNNKSGVKGVHWVERGRVWRAELTLNWKKILVGRFKSIEDAAKAMAAAREQFHGQFANNGLARAPEGGRNDTEQA